MKGWMNRRVVHGSFFLGEEAPRVSAQVSDSLTSGDGTTTLLPLPCIHRPLTHPSRSLKSLFSHAATRKQREAAIMSLAMSKAMPRCCTFTTTSSSPPPLLREEAEASVDFSTPPPPPPPLLRVALCTCATEAEARGRGSKALKRAEKGLRNSEETRAWM